VTHLITEVPVVKVYVNVPVFVVYVGVIDIEVLASPPQRFSRDHTEWILSENEMFKDKR